jgi:hypothetical protein
MSEIPEGIWRANCCTTVADGKNVSVFNGKWMVGDAFGSKIGYLDDTSWLEFGGQMGWWVQTGIVDKDRKWISTSNLELDMEAGVGTAIVTAPTIGMELSKDAGATWSTEQARNLGAPGEKDTRQRWNKLGARRQTIFRFTILDNVKRVVMAMHGKFLGRRS